MPELSSRRSSFLSFQPPAITEEEIDAVAATLRSGWLTTGPRTAELEARMREYLEAKHVLAVSSCTAALHLSLVALGIGPGDEVITSSITWPATANVIVHCGATPVFADVRDDTLNIDPEHVARARQRAHEGDHPDRSLRPAGRPRPAARTRLAAGRRRRARGRVALPRPQGRRDLGPDLLLALRDEEHRSRRRGADRDRSRRPRRRPRRPARDAARSRLALRHRRSRLQGEPERRPRLDRARAARQGREARRDSSRQVAIYDEGIADLDGIEAVARDPRDMHANHLYVVRVTFADRDECSES